MAAATGTLHQAFGLTWQSPNLEIPELPLLPATEDVAHTTPLKIEQEVAADWPELLVGRHDTPFLQMARGDLRFTVNTIGCFRITDGDRIAWQRQDDSVSDQDIRIFLLGSAMGALLMQRGLLVMHGNALEKNGHAIVCMGHSGAGKSTLAYALMQQGWRLLADDMVAITPHGRVLPGIPRIKLWHDATKAFGLDPHTLLPVRQGKHKYLLMGDTVQHPKEVVPLAAMYWIPLRRNDDQDPEDTSITPINSQKAASVLLRNHVYRQRFVRGLGQEGHNFMSLARLKSSVPLARLTLPSDIQAMQSWLAQQDLLTAAQMLSA